MARRRWLILTLLILVVILLEIIEHLIASSIFGKSELIGEIITNSVLIATAGTVVLYFFARADKERIKAINHLALFKELDTSIENAQDWDELIHTLVYFPRTILPVLYSQLFIYHPDLEEYALIAKWAMDESIETTISDRHPYIVHESSAPGTNIRVCMQTLN